MTKKWQHYDGLTDEDTWTLPVNLNEEMLRGAPRETPTATEVVLGDLKRDRHKPQWSLLPWDVLPEILKVVEYGDRKYRKDNWRAGSPPVRYWDAAFRHMHAWQQGEKLDPESGHPHLAHAVVSLLYAMILDK